MPEPPNLRVLCAECNVRKANYCADPPVMRYWLIEVNNRLRAFYGNLHPAFPKFHQAYLSYFDATASIDDSYVHDADLVAYAAAVEHQFGLVHDLVGVSGYLFSEVCGWSRKWHAESLGKARTLCMTIVLPGKPVTSTALTWIV
jgi:hypothetical protein